MASSNESLEYVLELLSETPTVRHRKMMGEYVLYSRGKVFGGIYDDRFLIKQTTASTRLLPDAQLETPYPGAKQMLLIDTEDPHLISEVVTQTLLEIPQPNTRRSSSKSRLKRIEGTSEVGYLIIPTTTAPLLAPSIHPLSRGQAWPLDSKHGSETRS